MMRASERRMSAMTSSANAVATTACPVNVFTALLRRRTANAAPVEHGARDAAAAKHAFDGNPSARAKPYAKGAAPRSMPACTVHTHSVSKKEQ